MIIRFKNCSPVCWSTGLAKFMVYINRFSHFSYTWHLDLVELGCRYVSVLINVL